MQDTEFLVFRLYGPLAAWGDVAVGEIRPIMTHPTKSALVGLLGASLGIRRDNAETISKMSGSYGFAVASEGRGTRLRDFHTVQSAPDKKEKLYGSGYRMNRQRELSIPAKELWTSLTYRDYLCDVIYTVAVWIKSAANAPFSLDELKNALREPIFVPYLGRKSCVLSRPMEPQIAVAKSPMLALKNVSFYGDSARNAFEGKLYVYNRSWMNGVNGTDDKSGQIIYEGEWDYPTLTEEVVRDEPLSRSVWQFGTRRVKRASFARGDV